MTQNSLVETMSLTEVGENIGLAEGTQLVKAFQEANPDATSVITSEEQYLNKSWPSQVV